MQEKSIDIDMNNVVSDADNSKNTNSNRTNIFNSTSKQKISNAFNIFLRSDF